MGKTVNKASLKKGDVVKINWKWATKSTKDEDNTWFISTPNSPFVVKRWWLWQVTEVFPSAEVVNLTLLPSSEGEEFKVRVPFDAILTT